MGAAGGFRTSRSLLLKHMVLTPKTTLLSSNCPGIDVIPVGDQDSSSLYICQCFHRLLFVSLSISHFLRAAAFDLDISEWREYAELNQLSSGFPKSSAHILDHISGSRFIFWGVRGGVGALAHQLLSDCDSMMFELQ